MEGDRRPDLSSGSARITPAFHTISLLVVKVLASGQISEALNRHRLFPRSRTEGDSGHESLLHF